MRLENIKKHLPFLSIFSVIKRFDEVNLYGQILLPLLGLFHFFFDRRIIKISFPLLFMIILNFVPMVQTSFSIAHFGRLGQLFFIILFMSFVSLKIDKDMFKKIAISLLILSVAFLFAELIFSEPKHFFTKFNLSLPRYDFILGEVNFSGALFAGMFYLSFSQRMKWISVGFFFLSLMTISRGVILAYFIWLMVWCVSRVSKKTFKYIFGLGIFLFLVYPALMVGMNSFMPEDLNKKLTRSSARYYLHSIYTVKGFENPFGVGYFKSRENIKDYLEEYKEKYPWISSEYNAAEQHSLQVQVFSDFGVIGYLLFSWFIFSLARVVYSLGEKYSVAFISLLVNFSFINGLSEWILWMSLGFYLSLHVSNKSKENVFLDWMSLVKRDKLI